jgi:hypothetical protein
MIPFSIMWGGFAIFWETMALHIPRHRNAIDLIFPLFGIPFVLMGLYIIFGRFFVDAIQRENIYYGISDRRVIIVRGAFNQVRTLDLKTLIAIVAGLTRHKVKSMDLRTLTDVSMTERSDGSGTITFGSQDASSAALRGFAGLSGPSAGPCFDMVEQVKSVYEQIRTAQRKA